MSSILDNLLKCKLNPSDTFLVLKSMNLSFDSIEDIVNEIKI
jgi:hypothetical protein